MNSIHVKAPATTANLGPGFDCLGMALDLWNSLEVISGEVTPVAELPGDGHLVEITGHGAGELAADSSNLIYRSMRFLFQEAGQELPPVRLRCHNEIPLARGLGSSAAAIAGGLVAANALSGGAFAAKELLEMAATIEGHPDNVAAAVLGGLQLVLSDERLLYTAPIATPPELQLVLFVPEVRIATEDARAVMPSHISVADAVHNTSRIALLVAGMATNHPEYFRLGTEDRLHQPYRLPLFPAMKVIFAAAGDAGALGVFLSGSGSTVLALTQGREMTVAYEMAEAARQANVVGEVKITKPTLQGAHLVEG